MGTSCKYVLRTATCCVVDGWLTCIILRDRIPLRAPYFLSGNNVIVIWSPVSHDVSHDRHTAISHSALLPPITAQLLQHLYFIHYSHMRCIAGTWCSEDRDRTDVTIGKCAGSMRACSPFWIKGPIWIFTGLKLVYQLQFSVLCCLSIDKPHIGMSDANFQSCCFNLTVCVTLRVGSPECASARPWFLFSWKGAFF
jgi:hypothetical protein